MKDADFPTDALLALSTAIVLALASVNMKFFVPVSNHGRPVKARVGGAEGGRGVRGQQCRRGMRVVSTKMSAEATARHHTTSHNVGGAY